MIFWAENAASYASYSCASISYYYKMDCTEVRNTTASLVLPVWASDCDAATTVGVSHRDAIKLLFRNVKALLSTLYGWNLYG